ncbi:MAG: SH3 domain-containing protein [Rhodospirillaceae bacterium]
MRPGSCSFSLLATLAALALPVPGGGLNAAEAPDKLTPQSSPTPVIQTLTATGPQGADGKPLPVLVPMLPPRPAPPLSPPAQKATEGAAPAAAPLSVTLRPDKAETPPPPAAKPAADSARAAAPEAKPAPPPAKSAATARKPERVVRYASTEINVRPRPNRNARRIDVIDEGAAVEVIGPVIDGKWVKVARRGEVLGYVVADYLLTHPPAPH